MPSMKKVFSPGWKSGGLETRCGAGSKLAATSRLRRCLPVVLREFGIKTINDAGCGDLNWVLRMDLAGHDYLGVDVVAHKSWDCVNEKLEFDVLAADICETQLRPADLTICRDVLIHLPNSFVQKAIRNFRLSSRYLLATSFDEAANWDRDILPGDYCKLDLKCEPFDLGEPVLTIQEKHRGKYLGLWKLLDDRVAP